MTAPNEMTATVVFKVGPVKATFGGKVTLSDLDPPNAYRISGEGSGGVAGFAKGGAIGAARSGRARCDRAALTRSTPRSAASSPNSARLIDSTAKKLAGEFFKSFADVVSAKVEAG